MGMGQISVSRGVQKLEQGGVRAAFMGAVQVGSNCPKNHNSQKSWKKAPTRMLRMYKIIIQAAAERNEELGKK